MKSILIVIVALISATACKAGCKPYFDYDKVEHYFFTNYDVIKDWYLKEEKPEAGIALQQYTLLFDDFPDTLTDTAMLFNLEVAGFEKRIVSADSFAKLDKIFCYRKHEMASTTACISVFRDVLIFRKAGKIVGFAKICFTCGDYVIAGAKLTTFGFGQAGDYDKLYNILHPHTAIPR